MAQVASDRPFPHPSVQGVPGPAIHTTVGLCDMRLACPSDDIRIADLPFEALYPNSSIRSSLLPSRFRPLVQEDLCGLPSLHLCLLHPSNCSH